MMREGPILIYRVTKHDYVLVGTEEEHLALVPFGALGWATTVDQAEKLAKALCKGTFWDGWRHSKSCCPLSITELAMSTELGDHPELKAIISGCDDLCPDEVNDFVKQIVPVAEREAKGRVRALALNQKAVRARSRRD